MSHGTTTLMNALRGLVDRLFERLERARLADAERAVALAANERDLSQRVHRIEVGEAPFA